MLIFLCGINLRHIFSLSRVSFLSMKPLPTLNKNEYPAYLHTIVAWVRQRLPTFVRITTNTMIYELETDDFG